MVEHETKRKLLEKSKAQGLTLTAYLEKIAYADVAFLDENVKAIYNLFSLAKNKKEA